ncbi:TetR/AcrR family transcriptional regulator [Bordetella genomosp. 5]|uniref:TetR family transcriptional regulator n=1 Tax=Bordetella genomosp. 5 TaxID=1395608 RepID=A0A261T3L1_9BORD|nr:TetR/AcrR family transcriptional regulator [Bordetella genomosp. 5]OZI44189.1 TetR family transcriptional regulator [Bordetella genomosp. 5]
MDTHTKLMQAAEALFHRKGFGQTGMDDLAQAAEMSSRTLYKHSGSKTALIASVLAGRDQRFMALLRVNTVSEVFDTLEQWIRDEGAHGCLFLRAHGETGGATPEIEAAVLAHKNAVADRIRVIVQHELGGRGHKSLAEQIVVLFEGATATAIYRGPQAVTAARRAAAVLMAHADR